ncbi:MAG: DUF4942 domain-containing protein, partial [Thermoanaerobaculia bacterium]
WYPTTDRMIEVVAQRIPTATTKSIMDVGAGDGRVLLKLAERCEHPPKLYAIEKSHVLIRTQPDNVIPVGTDLFEQNLACLPVDYIFSNPPYSEYELWASLIIEFGHAQKAFLVIPRRWAESELIASALKRRGATAEVIHSDDFLDAVRRARAVVNIVEISYPKKARRSNDVQDPFDIWFDQNFTTFEADKKDEHRTNYEREQQELARIRGFNTIKEMVDGYNEEHARVEANYTAIFGLDYALLKELGINNEAVREGIKAKMAGLKARYWQLLFERLDAITQRLSTATRAKFLEQLTGRSVLAFTSSNAYAVVLWAIKNANRYFGEQIVQIFRDLSTFDGVTNYKSNQRTWEKSGWRYSATDYSHYALDYRIVVQRYRAIYADSDFGKYDYPGNLHKNCHELIDDVIAVLYNLGFRTSGERSRDRQWFSNGWQNWYALDSSDVVFQAKAFKNGNLHFRFMTDAIKALNVEAGRLLGWLRSAKDAETELGYTSAEADRFFACTNLILPSRIKLLEGVAPSDAHHSTTTSKERRGLTEVSPRGLEESESR